MRKLTMKIGKVIKTFTSKRGRKVVFRYPKKEDLDNMLEFANGLIREDTYVALSGKEISKEEETKFLDNLLAEIEKGNNIHLAVFVNGIYAGNAGVRKQKLRKAHIGEVGIALSQEFRDEGIGKELLLTLIEEAKKMKLRLLTLNCFECNVAALALYKKSGFKTAGVIPDAIFYKGTYCGEVKMYLPLE